MKKPHLGFWQIWNMSFGFFGIQFGFALQNANVSRIFETLGAKIDEIPILWIAAPITGLVIQPIIGYLSDRTWTFLGRRRPYFLGGAILASAALIFMPNSPALWIAAGMLWIMDASINIAMEPFRAFVGDLLPSKQRTIGFSMQSFFIGTGAVIASLLPYLFTNLFGISNIAPEGEIPPSVKYAFYAGGIVFFFSVLWTVFRTREYSPSEIASFDDENNDVNTEYQDVTETQKHSFLNAGFYWLFTGVLLYWVFKKYIFIDNGLTIFFSAIAAFGLLQIISAFMGRIKPKNGLTEILTDLYNMPQTMIRLAYVQFFSWFALFAMWIYTTPAVTKSVFNATDPKTFEYNQGADWVGVLMSVYNGVAAIVAFGLVWLAGKIGRKSVHSSSLIAGGIGLLSFYFIKNQYVLLSSEILIGIAWASILAMPYAILTGSLPQKKLGVYMGIFNFFIVIPQITAAAILGFFVKYLFNDNAMFALVTGGVSFFLAALMMIFVSDNE